MWHKWILTKKEIKKWIDQKLHEFSTQENKNSRMSKEEWLNRYLHTKEHNKFFFSFPCKLCESLAKLADGQGMWKLDKPIMWTLELMRRLKGLENKIVRDVDYWIDSILGGFINKFAIDTFVSYSKDEC